MPIKYASTDTFRFSLKMRVSFFKSVTFRFADYKCVLMCLLGTFNIAYLPITESEDITYLLLTIPFFLS